jgi:DNA (cytosine-5)-methyltransferase 1
VELMKRKCKDAIATKAPTVVDLFSGAGGLSAGFKAAGYKVIGGLDFWKPACDSFKLNEPDARVWCSDVRQVDARDFADSLPSSSVDVVLGGPSCQGFSTSSGLSRLGRQLDDPRNTYFEHFVRFVHHLSPSWVVMENVPGLLLFNRGQVAREICKEFASIGYHVIPMILLAADHGVPQLRRRLVFIGNRTCQPIGFPIPSNSDPELWRDFALPFEHLSRIGNKNAAENLPLHVSLRECLSDLPPLEQGEEYCEGKYPKKAESAYQRTMRRASRVLSLHRASRLSPSDEQLIPHVPPGGNWRSLPEAIRGERFKKIRSYDATTMLKRPLWDKPSYTITTKFNDATAGAFIHPLQDRTFSIREAARIQSFPDSFCFEGTDSEIRKQIGNAVPPLLGQKIALAIAPEVFEAAGTSASAVPSIPRILFSEECSVEDLLGLKNGTRKKKRKQNPAQPTLFD